MLRKARIFLVLTALLFSSVPLARADTSVSFSFSFHDTLSPYGAWVNVASYGTCWRPYAAARAGWRPYLYGHWVYTSYGPTWIADEPWGWSVYHYGHWVYSQAYGWVWVPGYEWVPADVVWSIGDGYIGWCPTQCVSGYGYSPSRAHLWVFIGSNNFTYSNYASCAVQPTVVQTLFVRKTVQFNSRAPQHDVLERVVRRKIPVQSVQQHEMRADSRQIRMVVPRSEESKVLKHASMTARGGSSSSTMKKSSTSSHPQEKIEKPREESNSRQSPGSPAAKKPSSGTSHGVIAPRSDPSSPHDGKSTVSKSTGGSSTSKGAERQVGNAPARGSEKPSEPKSVSAPRAEPPSPHAGKTTVSKGGGGSSTGKGAERQVSKKPAKKAPAKPVEKKKKPDPHR